MPNVSDPAAKVYAQALLDASTQTHVLGTVYEDLVAVRKLYDDDHWFRSFFTSPRIDRQVKRAAMQKALAGQVHRLVLGLMDVLVVKSRESLLDNVVDQFDRFKDELENRTHAYVTVARPLDAAFRASLVKRLEAASGKHVELHERVDPEVLGGAAIRIGDRVIDRTVRNRLSALRKRLLEAPAPRGTEGPAL